MAFRFPTYNLIFMKRVSVFALFLLIIGSSCQKESPAFRVIPAAQSGIDFVNQIIENDSLNIFVHEFVYNGGGVAIGDLNGDGKQDLFFTGNQVDNELYLNEGELNFRKVTEAAGLQKQEKLIWSSGINILDINLDGKLDIYICNTLREDAEKRRNFLYVNQGNSAEGIPQFEEMGKAYGVDDPSHSSHAQFFDYDNDGDLDLFVGVNLIEEEYPNQFVELSTDGSALNRDNLFENTWSDSLGHPVFRDVSLAAGLYQDGYSHSTLIFDFNRDGWQDIYVANDYQSNDLIFINNQDGTFTNRAGDIFKHFSLSAMGSDVADINNDGAADFFTSEMQPYYNKRKKLFQGGSSYQNTILTERYNYEYQYTRNTLQLNQGNNPRTGLPVFAEIGMYAKVQETDWSWTTLFADYDNDGWKDLFIANGFPRDVTDRDFADFRALASDLVSPEELYEAIPQVKVPNFLFRNKGDLTFENKTGDWGMEIPSFSHGAAYGDLDNDGDLDLVTNNMNDPAFLFENKTASTSGANHLRVRLTGPEKNPDAFGASAEIRHQGMRQSVHLLSGRGYLSKSENTLHFGLGDVQTIDTLLVHWPDQRVTLIENVQAGQSLTIQYADANPSSLPVPKTAEDFLFAAGNATLQLHHLDHDQDYIDFNIQRTIPHKFSQYGPSIAVGDVNGDGYDDVFTAGSRAQPETWHLQSAGGTFQSQEVFYKAHEERLEEDAGSLLFDADNDGDLDLYIARGSSQYPAGHELYQDVLCVNDGQGQFSVAAAALPELRANASCVKAADFDGDGDLDLFVGSRVLPRAYPLPDRSYILRNESTPGNPKFVDATAEVNEALLKPGMVTDAIWTDFNNDHQPDLIIASEWAPIRFFTNNSGKLEEVTDKTGISNYHGWWNSLTAADLDADGDVDYIAGNFGENLYFRCTNDQPLRIYAKDWDDNGLIDPLISCYWQDSLGAINEYLYHPREDLIKQFVGIRKKFNTYGEYGEATMADIFSPAELEGATILSANWMKSSILENTGDGRFVLHALPRAAQFAPVYGILPYDVNTDGRTDLVIIGNDFGMETQQGRADALNGAVMINQGQLKFQSLPLAETNFVVPGNGIGLALLLRSTGGEAILATQNRDSLMAYLPAHLATKELIRLRPDEVKTVSTLINGEQNIQEFYWGSSFMAQGSRYVTRSGSTAKIEFFDGSGNVSRVLE